MAQLTWGSQGILDAAASVGNYFRARATIRADPSSRMAVAADSTTDAGPAQSSIARR